MSVADLGLILGRIAGEPFPKGGPNSLYGLLALRSRISSYAQSE